MMVSSSAQCNKRRGQVTQKAKEVRTPCFLHSLLQLGGVRELEPWAPISRPAPTCFLGIFLSRK